MTLRSSTLLTVAAVFATGLAGCSYSPTIAEATLESPQTLSVFTDDCAQDPTVDAVESDTEVVLTITAKKPATFTNSNCADGLLVQLREPLGDRIVIDGETGQEILVSTDTDE